MNAEQMAAVRRCWPQLVDGIQYELAKVFFIKWQVVCDDELRIVEDNNPTKKGRNELLLEMLESRPAAWEYLISYLRDNSQSHLSDMLQTPIDDDCGGHDQFDDAPRHERPATSDEQRLAIEKCRERLLEDINYEELKMFLLARNVLTLTFAEVTERTISSTPLRTLALIDELMKKDNGWEYLHEYLRFNCQTGLSNHLIDVGREALIIDGRAGTGSQIHSVAENVDVAKLVNRLRRHLIDEYTKSAHLPHAVLQSGDVFCASTYVTLQMMKQEASWREGDVKKDREATSSPQARRRISSNAELLSLIFNGERPTLAPIIIAGQPGQGKTTFVRKLAYDWAMQSDALFEQIELLFAFPLRSLENPTKRMTDFILASATTTTERKRVSEWMQKYPSKTLVVLDGFDELNAGCEELHRIMNEYRPPQLPPFPLIITTRPYAIPEQCPWPMRYQICPLTRDQAGELVEKYAHDYPQAVTQKLVDFCEAPQNSFLLSSPLLLHLLCYEVLSPREKTDDQSELRLTRSQTEAYLAIFTRISKRWQEKHLPRRNSTMVAPEVWINSDFVRKVSAFAFKLTFDTNTPKRLLFDKHEVVTHCGEKTTNEAIESGYLVADVPLYTGFSAASLSSSATLKLSFAHKTFHEFFAAVCFVEKLRARFKLFRFLSSQKLQNFLNDDERLMQESQILLFATGISFARESVPDVGKNVFQFVSNRMRLLLDIGSHYTYKKYGKVRFIWEFFESLIVELMSTAAGKQALAKWSDENASVLRQFAITDIARAFNTTTYMRVDESSFRSIWLSECFFIFQQTSTKNFLICEFTSPFELIEAEESATTFMADELEFSGTVTGMTKLFSNISVLSNKTRLKILTRAKKTPTLPPKSSCVRRFDHLARMMPKDGDEVKRIFGRVESLLLSSQLDATDVRKVFQFLSEVEIEKLEFFDDEEGYAKETHDLNLLPADEVESSTDSANSLVTHVDLSFAIPSCSAFEAVLFCIRKVDTIRVDDSALSLMEEFEKARNGRQCGRNPASVRRIDMLCYKSSPNGALARFVLNVKATMLTLDLRDTACCKVEPFRDFCKVLAQQELRSEKTMLKDLEFYSSRLSDLWDRFFSKMFNVVLVALLCCLHNLNVKIGLPSPTRGKPLDKVPADLCERVHKVKSIL